MSWLASYDAEIAKGRAAAAARFPAPLPERRFLADAAQALRFPLVFSGHAYLERAFSEPWHLVQGDLVLWLARVQLRARRDGIPLIPVRVDRESTSFQLVHFFFSANLSAHEWGYVDSLAGRILARHPIKGATYRRGLLAVPYTGVMWHGPQYASPHAIARFVNETPSYARS